MIKALIAVNAGSSTLKFCAYAMQDGALLMRGLIDHFGQPHTSLSLHDTLHQQLEERILGDDSREAAVAAMINTLADHGIAASAVVHRVVHGGSRFHAVTRLDDEICQALETYIPLAPLHQPVSLQVIQAFQSVDAGLPQLACFDTAFHSQQPEVATRFGIARHWHEEGVRRYGFHGLSYSSINRKLAGLELADRKVVVCHLGSGASACAIQQGQSVASSMGFSAVDGLMMGTRPGYLDPEVVLYWLEHEGMGVSEVRRELYKNSGLLGVSGGLSADMRALLEDKSGAAREAVELFCYRIVREIGSLAAAMKGLDAIIFTAGIGEHSAEVRGRVLAQLGWLGFELDHAANLAHAPRLTTAHSSHHAYVLSTDEEGEMARQAFQLLQTS